MKYLLLFSLLISCNTIKPRTPDEFQQTVVKIESIEGGGGSGVIYKSSSKGTLILTNAHICEAIVSGGFVSYDRSYRIIKYKASKEHDICYLFIKENLKVNTVLSKNAPEQGDKAVISGHPSLYPHVISYGLVSGMLVGNIQVDERPCDAIEAKLYPVLCIVEGMPVIVKRKAQLVSALISPGSSGSGVFNSDGELIGLAFAAEGNIGYALIVPWEFLDRFVRKEASTLVWESPDPNKTRKHYHNDGLLDLNNWKKILNLVK